MLNCKHESTYIREHYDGFYPGSCVYKTLILEWCHNCGAIRFGEYIDFTHKEFKDWLLPDGNIQV